MTADVQSIRDRHEGELLAIEGVEGVGVGEQDGRPTIKVYVDSNVMTPSIRARSLPKALESVPIVVEETGVFEAH